MSKGEATGPVICYIGLGSNVGDREANLKSALETLGKQDGVEIAKVSHFYETDPVGGPPQGKYLNGAAELATTLKPEQLLDQLQQIEDHLGRKRAVRWGPRTIDLDVLLYGEEVIGTPRLTVPHPLMHERAFVLEPLCEIAPDVFHPVQRKTASELLGALAKTRPHADNGAASM